MTLIVFTGESCKQPFAQDAFCTRLIADGVCCSVAALTGPVLLQGVIRIWWHNYRQDERKTTTVRPSQAQNGRQTL